MLCLQGGAEFGPDCVDMDAQLLDAAAGGRVVIAALAGAPGREYAVAGSNGARHFSSLGARDVVVAPDARKDPDGARAAIGSASLLVLPGGSPSRLLGALRSTGVGELVGELLDTGAVVLGSSAGAMVLCEWTVLPDAPRGPVVERGLGLAPGLLVVPHWAGAAGRESWLSGVPTGIEVVGLPEQSGVVVRDGELTAVGSAPTWLVTQGRALAAGQTWSRS